MRKVKLFQLILATLSILGWAVAVYALLVFGEARPERVVGTLFNQGLAVRMYWEPHETLVLQYLIWSCGGISLVSLAFNYYVAHHSKLGYWFNIPLLFLSSLAAGLYIYSVI